MRLGLIGLASFALTACAPDSANVEAEVQQLVRSYVTSTDIAASVNMLDSAPSVTSITGQGRIVRGRDAIKEEASKQIATLPQLKVTAGEIRSNPDRHHARARDRAFRHRAELGIHRPPTTQGASDLAARQARFEPGRSCTNTSATPLAVLAR